MNIVSYALIFLNGSQSYSCVEKRMIMFMTAFIITQLVATFIVAYVNWGFADIKGCGWG